MTVLVPQRRIFKPRLSVPRLNFRRLGDSSFNRLGIQGQPWGLGKAAAAAAQPYSDKVLSYSPIAYWPLDETSGTIAACQVDSNQNGTWSRNITTMGTGAGIGDGNTAPLLTPGGTPGDRCNIYSVTFRDAINMAEATLMLWLKLRAASIWTDSTTRYALRCRATGTANFELVKDLSDDSIAGAWEAGNVSERVEVAGQSGTDWMLLAITRSELADEFKFYKDGVQQGATMGTLGSTTGENIDSNASHIGDSNNSDPGSWDGYLAHAAFFNSVLSGADLTDLATV